MDFISFFLSPQQGNGLVNSYELIVNSVASGITAEMVLLCLRHYSLFTNHCPFRTNEEKKQIKIPDFTGLGVLQLSDKIIVKINSLR
jgi:hypothetical protein